MLGVALALVNITKVEEAGSILRVALETFLEVLAGFVDHAFLSFDNRSRDVWDRATPGR